MFLLNSPTRVRLTVYQPRDLLQAANLEIGLSGYMVDIMYIYEQNVVYTDKISQVSCQ